MAKKVKTKKFTTESGVGITLKQVKGVLVQKALRSVTMPEHPTYETTTMSGRVQTHRMDEKAASETEGGIELWKSYQSELEEAQVEQNNRVMDAVLSTGVDVDIPDDDEWTEELEAIGLEPRTGRIGRKLDYLSTILGTGDLPEIFKEIMRLTGAPEEVVKEVEDSFSDSIREE